MRRWRLNRSRASSSTLVPVDATFTIDDEISQLTKLQSGPCTSNLKALRSCRRMPIPTTTMLLAREANYSGQGRFSSADCSHVLGRYLPVNSPSQIDRMNSEAYVSQFSIDGSLLVAGFQGSRIRIYNVDNGWKVQKDINAQSLRWTITDTALSPDQRHLVYSSLTPLVHIVNVRTGMTDSQANITEIHEHLDFSVDGDRDSFNIFSIKFSTDGRELVAGGSDDSIYVYDLEANKLAMRIIAHTDDVNTVSFADETGHVMFSGSDDNLCKVWDRRCIAATGNPAGFLEGHLEGITFIDSRGDGHYFISNSKDQTTKLWDIRRMSSTTKSRTPRTYYDWDYRWMDYPAEARNQKHPCDRSVATYKGHSVLRTLIRCYFSPTHSTGQKYIYTGSFDKCVYIYDVVTGAIVAKLAWHNDAIRDCSWHPYYPVLVSSSWDHAVTRWEFPGSPADSAVKRKTSQRRHEGHP
ncbi:LEC14B homolog [Musa acuminata AAA Group]|uniref:LEC14B homolog n=1 Tax=Musa acuminata AAA Group TaxID=214697 RepID=UPI0031DA5CD6